MANNKIIFGGEVLIDLTTDTVTADKLANGVTAHDKTGAVITGTNTYDADTSDATASATEILLNKTAYVRGTSVKGTMKNNGAVSGTITTATGTYTVPQGYHDGSGKVKISSTEQAKIIPDNIREGITILGVEGTMSGSEDENVQTGITITPSKTEQTITPADGYTCFREVTVAAIPVAYAQNSAGGTTVTIG